MGNWAKSNKSLVVRFSVGACAVLLTYLLWAWNHELGTHAQTVQLKPGMSLRGFAKKLKSKGILSEVTPFLILARLRGAGRNVQAGEYSFAEPMSQNELLDRLIKGDVVKYPVTFIEGWNFKQVRQALSQSEKLEITLSGKSDREIMALLGKPELHPEGRFFPDTYHYSTGSKDIDILKSAFDKLNLILQAEWQQREQGLPLRSQDEALILASIIEKETGQAEERPLIASVFVNRLRKNMRLQTDPTVIYGMGNRYHGNIRKRDLLKDTPYNTYTRKGLTPTPIAMPSRESIHAALHPDKTNSLYFVAKGNGYHVFSETFAKHNEAVIKYQLKGRRKKSK